MIKFRYFIICTKIYHFSCHSIDHWRCISVVWKSFFYIDGVNKDFPPNDADLKMQAKFFLIHRSTLTPAPSRRHFFLAVIPYLSCCSLQTPSESFGACQDQIVRPAVICWHCIVHFIRVLKKIWINISGELDSRLKTPSI